jgi:hypothetical protein
MTKWTRDWFFRARKIEHGVEIKETINNEENDNDQS